MHPPHRRSVLLSLLSIAMATSPAALPGQSPAAPAAPAAAGGRTTFPTRPSGIDELRRLEAHVVTLIRDTITPATVRVNSCSGVIISPEGLVATAAHMAVNHPGGTFDVTLPNGRNIRGTLVGMHHTYDTAIIQLDEPGPYPHVEMVTDVDDVERIGQWIVCSGYPRPFPTGLAALTRLGQLVSPDAGPVVQQRDPATVGMLLTDDVRSAGGDSGGPLFDLQGRLLGVRHKLNQTGSDFFCISGVNEEKAWKSILAGEKIGQLAGTRSVLTINRNGKPFVPHRCEEILAPLAADTAGAVVEMVGKDGQKHLGAVCTADGWIVTKAGTWRQDDSVTCRLGDDRSVEATIVAVEPRYNLAVVRAKAEGLTPIVWARAGDLEVGRWIVAVGLDGKLLVGGVIAAVNTPGRSITTMKRGASPEYPELVWHTAILDHEPNRLGGPLINLAGEAVGIAIDVPWRVNGYMVPVDIVKGFLAKHGVAVAHRGQPAAGAAVALDEPVVAVPADLRPSRYWKPFEALPIQFDYLCPVVRDGRLETWLARTNRDKRSESILVRRPLDDWMPGDETVAFSTAGIRDFPDRADPSRPAEVVRLSRASVQHYPGRGYVALFGAFAGDPYGGGQHPLLPVILSSPTGKPGEWGYHGRLAGEPLTMENEKKRLWSDGGSIIPLPDGRWRVYLNGYGPTLAACEAASLDGPWTFLRDEQGRIRDIAAALPVKERMEGGAIFPYMLRVSEDEYHLWMCDQWTCVSVWHLSSADGLDFRLYGEQPEITLADSGGALMKGVRACVSPDGKSILGLIPFYRKDGWNIHRSTMSVGLQPASDRL